MKPNKTTWIICLIMLAGCTAESNTEKQILEIPAIIFLTGNQASLGEEIDIAFKIAKQDFENQNNISISLKIEDSEDDPKKAILAYNKFRADKYPLVISTGSSVTEALAPLVKKDKVVLLSTVSPGSGDIPNEWLFRSFITSFQQGNAIGKFISNRNISSIAILRLDNIMTVSIVTALKESLHEDINVLAEEKYGIADNDVRTQLLKIKKSNPDAIVVTGFGPAYPVIFSQIKELGINKPLFSDATISVPYFFEAAGGYETLDSLYFVATNFDWKNPINNKTKLFLEKYNNFSETKPSFVAGFGYDTLIITAKILQKCRTHAETIKSCLHNTKHDGLLGELIFNSKGELQAPIFIKQYKNNKTIIVKEIKQFKENKSVVLQEIN